MENPQNMLGNSDDAWIRKYRAAMDSVPLRQSKVDQLREIADRFRGLLASKAARVLERWSAYYLVKNHRPVKVRTAAPPHPTLHPRKLARPMLAGVVRSRTDVGQG
jgi:hypothetical protein